MSRSILTVLILFAFSTTAFSHPTTSPHFHKIDGDFTTEQEDFYDQQLKINTGIQVVPSDEFCKPIRNSVYVINDRFRKVVSMKKAIFLKTSELSCFNDNVRREARSSKNIAAILRNCVNYSELCQDLRTNLPSLNK